MNGTYGKIVMQIDSNIDRIGQEVSSRKLLYVKQGLFINYVLCQKRGWMEGSKLNIMNFCLYHP